MKLFTILVPFFLFLSACDAKSKPKMTAEQVGEEFAVEETPEQIADRLLVKPIYLINNAFGTAKKAGEMEAVEEPKYESEFIEIVTQIPITPLPFGISNLDEIDLSQAPNTLLEVPLEYDTENLNGLNDFFEEREELDPFVEHDGRCIPYLDSGAKMYFARRLPNLESGEIVLLYYLIQPEQTRIGTGDGKSYIKEWTSEKWFLIACKPSGHVVYSETSIFSADNYIRLSYIDENYNIRTKHYQTPTSRALSSDRTPNGEIDEVSDDVREARLTALFHESSYHLKQPARDEYFGEYGRWHGMDESHAIQYLWINNKAVAVKRY